MKGKDLLEKTLNKGKEETLDASVLFGDTPVINQFGVAEDSSFKTFNEEKKEESIDPNRVKLLLDEDLTADFVKKVSPKVEPEPIKEEPKEEPKEEVKPSYNKNALYDNLFGNMNIKEIGGEEEKEEEKPFIPQPEKKETIQEDIDSTKETIDEEELTEGMKKIKAVTESENYPNDFPSFEEVLELKKEHKDLLFVMSGNAFEQYYYDLVPEIYIATTLKSEDFMHFKNKGGNETDSGVWYPYLVSNCVLFPKIDFEEVFSMEAGTVKKLVDSILVNSRYQTSIEVTKL